jgi:hypothetical protein
MKAVAVFGTSILGLLLGTTMLANAQHGQGHQEAGHDRHQRKVQQEHVYNYRSEHGRHEAGELEQRHQQPRGPQEAVQRGPEHQLEYRKPTPGHFREASRHESEPSRLERRNIWERQRAQHWQREHRFWRERGGYHGYRIPEDRFRAHFGRGHCFRVHEVPVVVVERYPRFQFGGFWFSLVDPWPESWPTTWYRTDEVYIDYAVNDGYYLYNRQHPGISIAVNVSL